MGMRVVAFLLALEQLLKIYVPGCVPYLPELVNSLLLSAAFVD